MDHDDNGYLVCPNIEELQFAAMFIRKMMIRHQVLGTLFSEKAKLAQVG
jgi:hypothetical protein